MNSRRTSIFVFATLAVFAAFTGPNAAQNYPEKSIRIVTINAAGGPADIIARLLGDKFSAVFRQPVVVESMVGAAGNLAAAYVSRAVPDGYTLLMSGDAAMTTNVTLYRNIPYHPLKDLAPITQVVATPNILTVHPDLPAKTVAELVAYAKANPGKLNYGHGGIGFSTHLAGQVFKLAIDTEIQHVPFRTPAAQMTDLLTGRINMCFCNISQVLPHIAEGKLRGLAVTSLTRVSQAPDLPTLHESGFPGFDVTSWFALMAPARTPAPVIAKLHQESVRALTQAEVRQQLANMGMVVIANTPEELTGVILRQIEDRSKLIEAAKIELQ
jgi:tripartite-type tricarboxylate transporter receptor subunit TctC